MTFNPRLALAIAIIVVAIGVPLVLAFFLNRRERQSEKIGNPSGLYDRKDKR
jgi:uncharacterized protein YneF (UPF0154 family)